MTPLRTLVIGASGTIGSAVAAELEARGHDVVRASRSGPEIVDACDRSSVRALFERVGPLDAVFFCAGTSRFAPVLEMTEEDLSYTIERKLVPQVTVVQEGAASLRDGGSFTLTAGEFAQRPWPGKVPAAVANGALESFARAAALDLPRGLRINVVSPPYITETAQALGMTTEGTVSAAINAKAYVALAEGGETGQISYTADTNTDAGPA